MYGGYATGENLELVKNKRIVQSWRASDFPKGHESRITITLARAGAGTRLTLTHSGVPTANAKDIAEGWRAFYWTPMKALFAKKTAKRG